MNYSNNNLLRRMVLTFSSLSLFTYQPLHSFPSLENIKSCLPTLTTKDALMIGLQVGVPVFTFLNQKYGWFEDNELREHKRTTWAQQQQCNALVNQLNEREAVILKYKLQLVEAKNEQVKLQKIAAQEELIKAYYNHVIALPDNDPQKKEAVQMYKALVIAHGKNVQRVLSNNNQELQEDIEKL